MHLRTGIDVLLSHPPAWRTERLALVTNHAATTHRFEPSRTALLQAGFNIIKLFSPEHGLDTTGADGHKMPGTIDPLTGLPVISLYGDRLAPASEDLGGIDRVLFDIPDVGSRFYTYWWTLTHVLEACAAARIPLVLADRPNPLSGDLRLCEGPLLDETHCSSFIGRWEMPIRHSCTLGELATYFNITRNIGCSLEVTPCTGWTRSQFYANVSPSFVPLSPAIPSFGSALLYPGLCFLEATNISEGRGTATPFRVAGAPWMLAGETARLFNQMIPSSPTTSLRASNQGTPVCARFINFTPTQGKYNGQSCQGIMLHVTDTHSFQPVLTGWLLIRIIKQLHPTHFAWAPYPTHVNPTGRRHLDLLAGIPDAERLFDISLSRFLQEIQAHIAPGPWQDNVRPFLLYPQ